MSESKEVKHKRDKFLNLEVNFWSTNHLQQGNFSCFCSCVISRFIFRFCLSEKDLCSQPVPLKKSPFGLCIGEACLKNTERGTKQEKLGFICFFSLACLFLGRKWFVTSLGVSPNFVFLFWFFLGKDTSKITRQSHQFELTPQSGIPRIGTRLFYHFQYSAHI